MTVFTVNIDNEKSEKVVKAVLDALGLNYNVVADTAYIDGPLNKPEQRIYKHLKKIF